MVQMGGACAQSAPNPHSAKQATLPSRRRLTSPTASFSANRRSASGTAQPCNRARDAGAWGRINHNS